MLTNQYRFLPGFLVSGFPASPFRLRRTGVCQVSAQPPAKRTAGQIEKETEVSYEDGLWSLVAGHWITKTGVRLEERFAFGNIFV
jgi:hypothetical protein